jgi:hypothetical protein
VCLRQCEDKQLNNNVNQLVNFRRIGNVIERQRIDPATVDMERNRGTNGAE